MRTQPCPNCHTQHDTGVYVSGQRHRCHKCGIAFEVRREVVSLGQRPSGQSGAVSYAPRATGAHDTTAPEPGRGRAAAGTRGRADGAGATAAAARPPERDGLGYFPPGRAAPQGGQDVPAVGDVGRVAALETPAPVDALGSTFISATPLPPLVPGFELLEVLGRGGMGEVWRARQTSLGRMVAVKLLPPKLAEDPEFVARFAKESAALAALNHPNVIHIIDRGNADAHYYFVMELVEGLSLRDVMKERLLTPVEALKVVIQICRAVDYAHDLKIIHRDLKPENILLDARGHVKVADFGLAGMQSHDLVAPQLTATSVAMGTVNYMAPEQRRDAKHVDGRADLYSLGVMFYEMLVGELPLGRFRMPSERIPGLDRRFDELISQLMQPDPEARFARGAAVLQVAEPLLSDVSSSSKLSVPPVSSPRRVVVERGFRSFRNGLVVVGVLAVLGVVIRLTGGTLELNRDGLDVEVGKAKLALPLHLSHGHAGPGELPPNTDGELKSQSTVHLDAHGLATLRLNFMPGGKELLHAHAGSWRLDNGTLQATQAGNRTSGTGALIPRAYVDARTFSSDELTTEAEIRVGELDKNDFPVEPEAKRFAELAFRLGEVQISAFADPDTGMRLAWKYPSAQGDRSGNSGLDVQAGVADVVPVPMDRAFNLRLTFRRRDDGIQVDAAVDDQVFASRFLAGLRSAPGKVALGCRNLHCQFQALQVVGRPLQVTLSDTPTHEHAER